MKKIISLFLLVSFLFGGTNLVQAVISDAFINQEAKLIMESKKKPDTIIKAVGLRRSTDLETKNKAKYVADLTKNMNSLGDDANALLYFITYGTIHTRAMGTSERAGVLYSYKLSFNKLPVLINEWEDVVRIATGRLPKDKSKQAENKARVEFRHLYNREAIEKGDAAAIIVLAYGVRPVVRNKVAESKAISKFESIYKFKPLYANHWDSVRALAYSGVK